MNEENQKDRIENEKNIEKENNDNIKKVIDIVSKHIDASKTQEYFKFMKDVRKYRKKINNKKLKLKSQNMLETAYYEKNGKINTEFKNMVKDYGSRTPWRIEVETYNQNYIVTIAENFFGRTLSEDFIREANEKKIYLEQLPHIKADIREYISKAEEYEANIDAIKTHYAFINMLIMSDILEYYDSELEYWKNYLKEIVEKIDRIEELE